VIVGKNSVSEKKKRVPRATALSAPLHNPPPVLKAIAKPQSPPPPKCLKKLLKRCPNIAKNPAAGQRNNNCTLLVPPLFHMSTSVPTTPLLQFWKRVPPSFLTFFFFCQVFFFFLFFLPLLFSSPYFFFHAFAFGGGGGKKKKQSLISAVFLFRSSPFFFFPLTPRPPWPFFWRPPFREGKTVPPPSLRLICNPRAFWGRAFLGWALAPSFGVSDFFFFLWGFPGACKNEKKMCFARGPHN